MVIMLSTEIPIFDEKLPKQTDTTVDSSKRTTSTLVWTGVSATNQDSTLHVELSSDELFLKSADSLVNILGLWKS